MVWKLWFYLYLFAFTMLNFAGYYDNNGSDISGNFNYIVAMLVTLVFVISIAFLGALAYNKKLFPLMFAKAFSVLLPVGVVLFSIVDVYFVEKEMVLAIMPMSLFPIVSAIVCVLFSIPLIPIFFAIYKYICKFDTLESCEKSGWKMFASFSAMVYAVLQIVMLCDLSKFQSYNACDFILCLNSLYEAVFLIGYAFNKKILSQHFWKISAPLYLLSYACIFGASETYKALIGYDTIAKNISAQVMAVVIVLLFVFALYKYAFTDNVYKKEESV